MNIAEARNKCKEFLEKIPRDALIVAILILACSASFGFGFLAGMDGAGPSRSGQGTPISVSCATDTGTSNSIVASKNGTKYYLPTCAGANQISDANKVWFVSASAAEAAGYTKATNCKGL